MRILIADDDPTTLLLLESALKDWGYEVVSVRDGNAAWDILRSVDSPPLALLDWMMPGLSGIELCRKVRHESESPFTYLVLLTGKTRTHDVVQGMESGADDYLSKPFEEQELKVRLRAGKRIVDLHEALRIHATRDALTGTWNRRMILEILGRECARAARESTAVGVIMADIDHFKRINDTLGHLGGDAALNALSRRISVSLRPFDSVGRYGGEEFLLVLPGCDLTATLNAAERIRHVIADAGVVTPMGIIPVTVSFGAAAGQGRDLEADALIRSADDALYRAKQGGRNRVEAAIDSEILVQ